MIINGKKYMSKKEASEYLGVKLQYVTELKCDGKIRTCQIPKYKFKYFLEDDIKNYDKKRRKYNICSAVLETSKIEQIDKNTIKIKQNIFKNSSYAPWFFVNKEGTVVYRKNDNGEFYSVNTYHDKHKHMTVAKAYDGKSHTIFVHRLVLESFGFPKPSKKAVCRHINDVPDDNRLENLKWGTQKENIRDFRLNHYIAKEIIKYMKINHPEILNEFINKFTKVKMRGTKTGVFEIDNNMVAEALNKTFT